jgi:hypothetical protein
MKSMTSMVAAVWRPAQHGRLQAFEKTMSESPVAAIGDRGVG